MKKTINLTPILYIVMLVVIFSIVMGYFVNQTDELPESQLVQLFENKQVKSFVMDEDIIELKLHKAYNRKTELKVEVPDPDAFREEMYPLWRAQLADGTLVSYQIIPLQEASGSGTSTFNSVLRL